MMRIRRSRHARRFLMTMIPGQLPAWSAAGAAAAVRRPSMPARAARGASESYAATSDDMGGRMRLSGCAKRPRRGGETEDIARARRLPPASAAGFGR